MEKIALFILSPLAYAIYILVVSILFIVYFAFLPFAAIRGRAKEFSQECALMLKSINEEVYNSLNGKDV